MYCGPFIRNEDSFIRYYGSIKLNPAKQKRRAPDNRYFFICVGILLQVLGYMCRHTAI